MKLIYILALMFLTSCTHGARIQYDYLDVRDECRDFSEDNSSAYVQQYHSNSGQLSGRDKNAILAKLFADCMYQKGWTVATPSGNRGGQQRPQQQNMQQQPQAPAVAAPPIRYIPAEPIRPATNMPIPANRQRINQ